MPCNRFTGKAKDLVTTQDKTKEGFLNSAREKNKLFSRYVDKVLDFKTKASGAKQPEDLFQIAGVEEFLQAASGLSEKSCKNLDDEGKNAIKKDFLDNYLKQDKTNFIDEAAYRYLLAKGDAVGGEIRNKIGLLGQAKLVRSILNALRGKNMEFKCIFDKNTSSWEDHDYEEMNQRAEEIKGLRWKKSDGEIRGLFFNSYDEIVKKNVDLSLWEMTDTANSKDVELPSSRGEPLMLGELKSGIDPAGADEHWKTARTALKRIKDAYNKKNKCVKICFIGAAITETMAKEIYKQLNSGYLSNAANLTKDDQLAEMCNWIIDL